MPTSLHWLLAGLAAGTWQSSAQHLTILRRGLAELALGQNGRGQVGQWSTTLWSHAAVDAEPWVGRGRLAPDFGVTCAGLADGKEEKEDEVDDEEDGVEDGEGFDAVELGIERAGGDCVGEKSAQDIGLEDAHVWTYTRRSPRRYHHHQSRIRLRCRVQLQCRCRELKSRRRRQRKRLDGITVESTY